MSSILTNNSAMVALQTLKSINGSLAKTQNEISTGKSISNAKDNSAVWAISKVMESDVGGFKAISDSLALGQSTVAVANAGAEQITDLLVKVKEKVIASQEQNVDRTKIQTDISQLRDQVVSIVGAAQFNGLNFLNESGTVSVLSSLDRAADGTVTASSISVSKVDLSETAAVFGTSAVGSAGDLVTNSVATALDSSSSIASTAVAFTGSGATDGASYGISIVGAAANDFGTTSAAFEYVANASDTELDVSQALFDQVSAHLTENGITDVTIARNATNGTLTISNQDTTAANTVTVGATEFLDGTAAGGMASLGTMDVTTDAGAAQALTDIENLIQTSINATASFGSAQGRIEIQSNFVSKLTDAMKSGIGSMVDADMEEASARLQALQVQQQLGVQSLSIANQGAQSIMSLFR